MKIPKVTDGELAVLDILWEKGDMNASDMVKELKEKKDWNRNTTYTFINRLVNKGIVERSEPNFLCRTLYDRQEVGLSETKGFVEKMFQGSFDGLVSAFISSDEISTEDIRKIEEIIRRKKEGK
ncbi:BlaI/MecI/CopY family transcriptional regulator [Anaeropeptidivorans aminofermentans]|uniref:BlaI/MecI/CopY family transcriptional regulator n=1 Tax=Anaeropeptidivorans aminofermentans TaxID=2934315 RepID=UPI00202596FE|nr:BlaI/MecI/CopY family transcriptional regulator [Anaeropeptidivorans aminofermentans]